MEEGFKCLEELRDAGIIELDERDERNEYAVGYRFLQQPTEAQLLAVTPSARKIYKSLFVLCRGI